MDGGLGTVLSGLGALLVAVGGLVGAWLTRRTARQQTSTDVAQTLINALQQERRDAIQDRNDAEDRVERLAARLELKDREKWALLEYIGVLRQWINEHRPPPPPPMPDGADRE